jgi:putative acetyltransferase
MTRDEFAIRKAEAADAPAIAGIHRAARRDALPYLPDLHTPEGVLAFFRDRVLTQCEVWVGTLAGGPVAGFCVLKDGRVDHLYVAPEHQGRGLGGRLLRHAMGRRPSLQLWTFQRNVAARRFYEKHGFVAIKETNGSGNEEREPDVLYAWSRSAENEPTIRPTA